MRSRRPATLAGLFLTAAATALVFVACSEQRTMLEPEDDALASQGVGAGTVDVIVVLKDRFAPGGRAANRSRAAEAAEELGMDARFTYGSALFGFAGAIPEGRLSALRNHPLVAYVDFDGIASIPPTVDHHSPNHGRGKNEPDPQLTPWGTARVGALESAATGLGVSVYILDTGIDSEHTDLQAHLGEGHASVVCEGCPKPWDDDHSHGTHVAGTVGAIDNLIGSLGVAPQVTLHAVKVLSSSGSGFWSGIVDGIDWVTAHNPGQPRVINMSLGGGGPTDGLGCTLAGYVGDPNAVYESLCNAKNAGVVIVASAGNSGNHSSGYAPAAYYDAVITVSAADCEVVSSSTSEEQCSAGTESWTTWSNWGMGEDEAWPSRSSLPVLISAPGARVASTVPGGGIGWKSGTSMAAPHVAGAVALLLEGGGFTSDGSAFAAVRQALLDNAECSANWENRSGNPHHESFLNVLVGSGDCPPPPPLPDTPAVPTGFTATALSDHEIQLTWAYEEPVPTDIEFQLTRWDGTTSSTSPLLGQELSYTNTGLAPEATYTYKVRAVNLGIGSEWSAEATATTLPTPEVPEYPGTFTYTCNKSRCDFVADYHHDEAFYTWAVGASRGPVGPGVSAISHNFTTTGEHTVELTIDHGTRSTTSSRTVICEARGRNVWCQ